MNTSLDRITTRVNLDYNVSSKLRFFVEFSYNNSYKESNYEFRVYDEITDRTLRTNIREMAYRKAPNMSIWELDENGNKTGEYFTPIRSYQGTGSLYYNPVAMSELGKNNTEDNIIETSFFLKYNILPWLTFQEVISFT